MSTSLFLLFCILLLKSIIAPEPNCDYNIDSCKAKVRLFYKLKDELFSKCFSENDEINQKECKEYADAFATKIVNRQMDPSEVSDRTSLGINIPHQNSKSSSQHKNKINMIMFVSFLLLSLKCTF